MGGGGAGSPESVLSREMSWLCRYRAGIMSFATGGTDSAPRSYLGEPQKDKVLRLSWKGEEEQRPWQDGFPRGHGHPDCRKQREMTFLNFSAFLDRGASVRIREAGSFVRVGPRSQRGPSSLSCRADEKHD